MPALLVFYIFSTDKILILIIIALLLSCAGDILLIFKDKQIFFRLGLVAFLACHVFYIIAFLLLTRSFNYLVLVISVVIAVPAIFFIIKLLKAVKGMRRPVIIYAVVIMLMSMSALQLMLSQPGFGTILLFIGSVIFLFSDSLMAYLMFHGKPKHYNFITMLPYIIAQGCIIMGLVLKLRVINA